MEGNVTTISSNANCIEGFRRTNILFLGRTKFIIDDALLSTKSKINLLSFKDIQRNGYYMETMNEDDIEYLYITSIVSCEKCVLEKLFVFSFVLYYTNISTIEVHATMNHVVTILSDNLTARC